MWNNPLRFFDPGGYIVADASTGAAVLGTPVPKSDLAYYVAPGGTTPRRSGPGLGSVVSGGAGSGASVAGAPRGSAGTGQTFANNTSFSVSNNSSGFHFSATATFTKTSGGNGCTTDCVLTGQQVNGLGAGQGGGTPGEVPTGNGIIVAAGPGAVIGGGVSSGLGVGAALAGKPAKLTQQPEDNLLAGGTPKSVPRSGGLGGFVSGACDGFKRAVGVGLEWASGPNGGLISDESGGADGPYKPAGRPDNPGEQPTTGEGGRQ